MDATTLAEGILAAIEAAKGPVDNSGVAPSPTEEAQRRERMRAAIEQTLAKDLGLAELKSSLAGLTQRLETESPFDRADIRAAAARTLRVLAALRI